MGFSLTLALALQVAQANVVGVVRDRITGVELEGAIVSLTDVDLHAVTDTDGRFSITDVPPGPHHLSVEAAGFEPRALHALVPRGGRLEVNFALRPDPLTVGGVEVRPRIPVPHADDGSEGLDTHASMSIAAIRNHPLLSEADAFGALQGGEVFVNPESPSGVLIQGGTGDQTGYELDGIPILAPHHTAGLFSAWNPDALAGVGVSYDSDVSSTLSGVVRGRTRRPGNTIRGAAALSTTQSRATLDGPLGGGFGYVFSARAGRTLRKRNDSNYLGSESGDLIAKVEGPLAGGLVRALVYQNENELDLASVVDAPLPGRGGPPRNGFESTGTSLGTSWTRRIGGTALTVSGWHGSAGTAGDWSPPTGHTEVDAVRRERGGTVKAEAKLGGGALRAGVRVEGRSFRYDTGSDSDAPDLALASNTRLLTGFGGWRSPRFSDAEAEVGVSVTRGAGGTWASPRLALEWGPIPGLTFALEASRRHQFTQSLRNRESLATHVLPMTLAVAAGGSIPVASSDQIVFSTVLMPAAGARVRSTIYGRRLRGFAQAASANPGPFALDGVSVGTGTVAGFSIDGGMSGTRYGLIGSYGWQRVRFEVDGSTYAPTHGVAHRAQAGATLFPTPTVSIRLGATGQWGRTATGFSGAFEWEACNLQDFGCEFGGTPQIETDGLGGLDLPPYLRVDLGVRKHWHLTVGPVSGAFGVYGTVSNLFGRDNVLSYGLDPTTGEVGAITMLPRGPLVLGADWRF